MKPPFKWVGGKTKLLPHISKFLPREAWGEYMNTRNYFEPMMGGGALFFDYGDVAQHCYLNDICYPLMNAYRRLDDNYAAVRREATLLDALSYNEARDMFNLLKSKHQLEWDQETELAALFCMLMGTCFNALYRENRSGGFNVPQGANGKGVKHPWSRVDWERLKLAGAALRGATLSCGTCFPWPPVWPPPGLGDVVFYDPPYLGEFSDYSATRFGREEHQLLHHQAQEWAARGARVIVCGSNNEWSWGVYGKPTAVIAVRRNVGASLRGDATEALYVYGA